LKSKLMPWNTKSDPSLLKKTSHWHSIPENSLILKRDTL
jgi:hypothetical protein